MRVRHDIGGMEVDLELSAVRLDDGGHLTLAVHSTPKLPASLFRYNLRLKILQEADVLEPASVQESREGLDVSFQSAALAAGGEVPSRCDLFWGKGGETYLGRVVCMRGAAPPAPAPAPAQPVEPAREARTAKRGGCLGALMLLGLGITLATGFAALLMIL